MRPQNVSRTSWNFFVLIRTFCVLISHIVLFLGEKWLYSYFCCPPKNLHHGTSILRSAVVGDYLVQYYPPQGNQIDGQQSHPQHHNNNHHHNENNENEGVTWLLTPISNNISNTTTISKKHTMSDESTSKLDCPASRLSQPSIQPSAYHFIAGTNHFPHPFF